MRPVRRERLHETDVRLEVLRRPLRDSPVPVSARGIHHQHELHVAAPSVLARRSAPTIGARSAGSQGSRSRSPVLDIPTMSPPNNSRETRRCVRRCRQDHTSAMANPDDGRCSSASPDRPTQIGRPNRAHGSAGRQPPRRPGGAPAGNRQHRRARRRVAVVASRQLPRRRDRERVRIASCSGRLQSQR